VRQSPFLVTLHYAFQTDAKLHLILGEYTWTDALSGLGYNVRQRILSNVQKCGQIIVEV
jgi:hypothetical protein